MNHECYIEICEKCFKVLDECDCKNPKKETFYSICDRCRNKKMKSKRRDKLKDYDDFLD